MRTDNSLQPKGFYEFGDFRLRIAERVLTSGGRPISVAPKVLDVLFALVENRGHIVDKQDLIERVWPGIFVEENNLAFNISVLRKLLGESSLAPRYIETIPKRGYRFIAEVVEVPEEASATRAAEVGSDPKPAPSPAARKFPGWRTAIAGAAVLAAAYLLFAAYFRRKPILTDRDTIVLADFVNKTGDPVFDGTLHQGLAVQLEQSPFLSLISEQQIRRTLRLMRQPADARLTPELAQEVCERTGSSIVLEGSITAVGKQYVLGLRAKTCGAGDIVDNEQAQVERKEKVLDALTGIAHKFRLRAGESGVMLGRHDVPLAEATTASLDALKAYSEGWKILSARGATGALPLFRRATELDPEFAMAHAWLGRIYADVDLADLSAASLRKAWQMRDRTSDLERFFITVNYQLLVTGNLEEARKTGEAWTRIYPRDSAPQALLSGSINKFPGRYEEAAGHAAKAIEIDPDFGITYYNLAVNNAYLNRFAAADEALQRAAARGLEVDEFLMLQFDIAFLRNDSAAMERVAARVRERSGPGSWISNNEAAALAYTGRLQRARSMSRRAVEEAKQGEQQERAALWETSAAIREALFGNAPEARERAMAALELSTNCEVEYGAAFALALAGYKPHAQKLVNDLESRFPEDTSVRFIYLPVLRAQLALGRGEPAKAVAILQGAVANELGVPRSVMHGYFGGLYPIYVRGEAYLASHRYAEAAEEFQKILDHRGIVTTDPTGALAHLQLGRALASAGDVSNSKIAYHDFLTLWGDADPSLRVLQRARTEFSKLP